MTIEPHALLTFVRSPLPSFPTTRTVGPVTSTSPTSFASLESAAAPTTAHPSRDARSRNWLMAPRDAYVSRASAAPEDAFETTGESGAEFFAHRTTPSTPRKCAERSTGEQDYVRQICENRERLERRMKEYGAPPE